MRHLLLALFLLLCSRSLATTTYYVSAAGNDANNGTSTGTSWQTISKINSFFNSFNGGDTIKFNRGDVFTGSIIPTKGGNSSAKIVFSAYGTGLPPVISGFVTLSSGSWTTDSSGISNIACSSCAGVLRQVLTGGVRKDIGRFPKTGFVTDSSTNGTTTIIIGAGEVAATKNWVGAELVSRDRRWIYNRDSITAQSTNTFTVIRGNTNYTSQAGWGLFFQNGIPSLTQSGDWCYNSQTQTIRYYWGTGITRQDIQASVTNYLVQISSFNYFGFYNLRFQGANLGAFNITGHDYDIINCDIDMCGEDGILASSCSYLTMQNDTITNCYNNAFRGVGLDSIDIVSTNIIHNIGTVAGSGKSQDGCYEGINIVGKNNTITYNKIDTVGYNPIHFQGDAGTSPDATTVEYNKVDYYCYVKDDGGGIYTYRGNVTPPFTAARQSFISYNRVTNGIGALAGTSGNSLLMASSIYLDQNSDNFKIVYNVAAFNGLYGIYFNESHNDTATNNTVYNNTSAGIYIQEDSASSHSSVTGLYIQNNIAFGSVNGYNMVSAYSQNGNTLSNFGTINNNRYSSPNGSSPFLTNYYDGSFHPTSRTLTSWISATGYDANSTNIDTK